MRGGGSCGVVSVVMVVVVVVVVFVLMTMTVTRAIEVLELTSGIRFLGLWSVSRSSCSHIVRCKTQDDILFQTLEGYTRWNEQIVVRCKSDLAEEQDIWGTSCQEKRRTHTARP